MLFRIEEGKIALRNLRREALEELKRDEKNKDISQDEYKRTLSQLQKLTDSFTAQAEQTGQDKEVELMESKIEKKEKDILSSIDL